jgi:serine/threonine protein phosphatase PrpC
MLTLVETISLAGDRKKQNDDASGKAHDSAWVIDGATDLHDRPLSTEASDATWIAQALNIALHSHAFPDSGSAATMRASLRDIIDSLIAPWWSQQLTNGATLERWQLPTASVLITSDHGGALQGIDLGDSRCFALDADGVGHNAGSRENGADDEQERARQASKRSGTPALLRDSDTMTMLRAVRARHNLPDGYWVFGLQRECADHARVWTLPLKRPAHVLLCTDGFSALVDRYKVYDAGGLVKAALDKGLQELGRELRAIEADDAGGAAHPRFKKSDDASAVLLRLT